MFMRSRFIVTTFSIALLLVGCQGISPRGDVQNGTAVIRIIDGTIKEYVVDLESNDTVETLMQKAQGLTYKAKEFAELGSFVTAINEHSEDRATHMTWVYYLNDAKAIQGISTQTVHVGDRIEWKYEKELSF